MERGGVGVSLEVLLKAHVGVEEVVTVSSSTTTINTASAVGGDAVVGGVEGGGRA